MFASRNNLSSLAIWALLCASAGCGRFGFDALGIDNDGGASGPGNDADITGDGGVFADGGFVIGDGGLATGTVGFGEGSGDIGGVTRDTFLAADDPTIRQDSDDRILATDESGKQKVGLIRFDLSSVPWNSPVRSATLYLSVGSNGGEAVGLHRLVEEWDGAATWENRLAGTPWTTAGAGSGSITPGPMATIAATPNNTTFEVVLPPALVESWVEFPAGNNGLAFVTTTAASVGFLSSEDASTDTRPRLVIEFN